MIESYLFQTHYDLVTPDGSITKWHLNNPDTAYAELCIENISPTFVGFFIDKEHIVFNLKSTLAQLGLNAIPRAIQLDPLRGKAQVLLDLKAFGPIGKALLQCLTEGAFIGKLFAADPRRRVRNPDYLLRMFGRADKQGRPLLSLGGPRGRDELLLEKIEGRTVAFLRLQPGILSYDEEAALGLMPTIGKALCQPSFRLRTLIQLHQISLPLVPRMVSEDKMLLVRTVPLHIRTAFGKVVDTLLQQGVHHTAANVLEPDTTASGDVYELYGNAFEEVERIPIEFFTLEPYREHVFFSDRDQLQSCLEDSTALFNAFKTATAPLEERAALFVVKGEQLLHLQPKDWIYQKTKMHQFPGLFYPEKQALLVQHYIEQQPCYPFLKAIEDELITSQGILLSRYFPSPLLKRLLLSSGVQRCLKAIYFQYPSLQYGNFFSHEDRSLMLDLAKFGIPLYWVDETSKNLLQYVPKPGKDAGMFVPIPLIDTFIKATVFGIYGSTLLKSNFEEELSNLLRGIIAIRSEVDHPMLNANTPIALVTGGGPGLMEMGNKIAKRNGVLSCANMVDFSNSENVNLKEQAHNPYIEAKMTYRLDRLVERQAEFYLDFPIILKGGVGTDFENCLEEVRRKVGAVPLTPVLLFGEQDYWKQKITPRYQCNLAAGTLAGSEWLSNCFYCVHSAEEGIKVYRQFFSHTLPIGPHFPPCADGFCLSSAP